MELLLFRTDINSRKKVKRVTPVFNQNMDVLDWSVDLEDIDNVLRIEATPNLSERQVQSLLSTHGFYVEVLTD